MILTGAGASRVTATFYNIVELRAPYFLPLLHELSCELGWSGGASRRRRRAFTRAFQPRVVSRGIVHGETT